jgi:C-terminal processing protease CtpA/Prc
VFFGNSRCVGIPFVQESAIVIDYPNKKLYTNELPQKTSLSFGCRFKITNREKIVVSSIKEDSFATKQGLRLGDELIAFDDIEREELKTMIRNGNIYEKMDSTIIVKRENAGGVSIISRSSGE